MPMGNGIIRWHTKIKTLKKQITLRLDPDVIEYFKKKAEETGIPYQSLSNLYLQDCRATGRELKLTWS